MVREKSSLVVFIWSFLIYVLNLQYNLTSHYDNIIFWFSVLVMFTIVIFQIFLLKCNPNIVIFEIFIMYILLHLVYQVGYFGLRGSDSYTDYNFLKHILSEKHFVLEQSIISGWPMIHIFSAMLNIVSNIKALTIAKFIPSVISAIIVFPLYLLSRNVYNDEKIALFALLVFGTIPQFLTFEALFVRESFGLLIMILLFYSIDTSKRYNSIPFRLLSLLLTFVMILSHHFTSFMFLILISIWILLSNICSYMDKKYMFNFKTFSNLVNVNNTFILFFILLLGYWIYCAIWIVNSFTLVFYEVTGVQELVSYAEQINLGAPIVTLRGNIIYYGFYFFNFIFVCVLILNLVLKKYMLKLEDLLYSTFFLFANFYGFLSLYVLGSLILPQRFLSHAWMFGILPLVSFLNTVKSPNLKRTFVSLLFLFMLFNIYNIDPSYITSQSSILGVVSDDQEYILAETIQFSNYCLNNSKLYYADVGTTGAIYDVQGLDRRYGKSIFKLDDFCNSSEIAIINEKTIVTQLENLKKKSYPTYVSYSKILSYKNTRNIHKICHISDEYYVLTSEG